MNRSWVNGVSSFSKTYTYFLTPKVKGQLTIGQAQITIDGELYKTTPIEIVVTEAVEKPNDPNNATTYMTLSGLEKFLLNTSPKLLKI